MCDLVEQLSSASSVVKQCLCGWADDFADEQLGLQLQPGVCVCVSLHVCVCLGINLTLGWV